MAIEEERQRGQSLQYPPKGKCVCVCVGGRGGGGGCVCAGMHLLVQMLRDL